ncbi:MAG: 50S ribosomal protein L5 [bacterium]
MKIPRLKERYTTVVVPALTKELGENNVMALPRLSKVVINVGVGKFAVDAKKVEAVVASMTKISGQRPVITKAKRSISNFKIRKGLGIGVLVTLRGPRMYDFLDKLINITLPRVRDFHGLPRTAFDAQGNYSIAFREHNVFPEIHSDGLEFLHGLQVTICTTAETPSAAAALLKHLGFPLQEKT